MSTLRVRPKMLQLPPLLRPRLTWKYVLCSALVVYVSYCFLFSSPLLASKLPNYTGPYSVGSIDMESAVQGRTVSEITFKDSDDLAFPLDTVLFTLYYPATIQAAKSKPRHFWIPKPLSLTGEGFARFGSVNNFLTNNIITGALWSLVGGITIPARVDVPLVEDLAPALHLQDERIPDSKSAQESGLPVMVFSHGYASSRTDYTHYLGELASRGYVVAAIEHRDGSSPASVVRKPDSPPCTVFPIKSSHLSGDIDSTTLKTLQLSLRQAEVEETIKVLRRINHGDGSHIYTTNPYTEGVHLPSWQRRLNMDAVTVAGHSFGATLALQTLRHAPSPALPLAGAIALDPGKSSGRLNTAVAVPLLIIHSNSWSATLSPFFGRPHFDVVRDLARSVLARGHAAWFLTSLGTSHPSVTDAPLLEPCLLSWTTGATIDVKEGVRQYVLASDEFLQYQHKGTRDGLLAQNVSHPAYKDPRGHKSALDAEYREYWQVHVAPPQE